MIAHVVLFRPSPSLSDEDREALVGAMTRAFSDIDRIARVRVGRRTTIGRDYEARMREHFEWVAILEFETEADLRTYLDHPSHAELGRRFFASAEMALVYDFVIGGADSVPGLLDG